MNFTITKKSMLNLMLLIFLGIIVTLVVNILSTALIHSLFGDTLRGVNDSNRENLSEFVIIFVGPLIETIAFQWMIIRLILLFKFRFIQATAIIISAFAFGLSHYYSIHYMLVTFLIGICLAYFFIVAYTKFRMGFSVALLIHVTMNAFVYYGYV